MLTSRGYAISKKDLDQPKLNLIRNNLTVKPKETPYTCMFVDYSFKVYTETDDTITVPRFWGIKEFGPPKEDLLLCSAIKLRPDLILNAVLRDYQLVAMKEIIKNIRSDGATKLQVECGWGKTLAGIYTAYVLGYKTLIIAPRVKIVSQWISEIKRFIPNAKVGLIQGQTKEINNVDFCVATLQTIGLKEYLDSDFKSFGFVIFDELPFFAANQMSTTLWKVYSKYTLGLSADPSRADGLDKIFDWYLGATLVKSSKPIKRRFNPFVKIIYPKEVFHDKYIEKTGNLNLAGMINDLTNSKERFNILVSLIKELLKDKRRKILVMADRREYLKKLSKEINCPNSLVFLGGSSKKQLLDIDQGLIEEKYDIIFATYALIGVGVSIDYLNTAIFVTPKKDRMTEQASGRIMRKDHDIEPLIIDIVDNNGVFKNQASKRLPFYKKKGWTIRHINLDEKTEVKVEKTNKVEDLSIEILADLI